MSALADRLGTSRPRALERYGTPSSIQTYKESRTPWIATWYSESRSTGLSSRTIGAVDHALICFDQISFGAQFPLMSGPTALMA